MRALLFPLVAGLLSFWVVFVILFFLAAILVGLLALSATWSVFLAMSNYLVALVVAGYVCARITRSMSLQWKLVLAGLVGTISIYLASFIYTGGSYAGWLYGASFIVGATLSIMVALVFWRIQSAN